MSNVVIESKKLPVLTEGNAPQKFIPIKRPGLVETKQGRKVYAVEGIFSKVDKVNENNRKYPLTVWRKNLAEGSNFMNKLKSRVVLGELEHPESGNTHLERVSHLLTNVWMETLDAAKLKVLGLTETVQPGQYILGRYEILETPKGKILQALYEAGVPVGISSRGRGDVTTQEGVDVVQDNYEVDTFDAVYLPSVVEARPRPVNEAEGDLGGGSSLPDASAQAAPAAPPANGNWKKEAEEIVRALQDAASSTSKEIKELVELLPRGLEMINQLSAVEDAEAEKLKAQATTLLGVLTNKIMEIETGKGKAKKESLTEANIQQLAATIADERKKANKKETMFKGELESTLKKYGHPSDPGTLKGLSDELKRQGVTSVPDAYEDKKHSMKLKTLTESEVEEVPDGAVVMVDPKDLQKRVDTGYPTAAGENPSFKSNMCKWLDKQDGEVPARVTSKGCGGLVVRVIEPAFACYDIFIPFNKAEKPEEEEAAMKGNVKQMVEALVLKNRELSAQLAKKTEGVDVRRYEKAKELIAGLVERVKSTQQALIREQARVKAAVKLIHKIQEDAKASSKPEAKTPVTTEAKPEEKGKVVTEAKVEEKSVEATVTTESKELKTRILGGKVTATETPQAPVVESGEMDLMAASARRLHG